MVKFKKNKNTKKTAVNWFWIFVVYLQHLYLMNCFFFYFSIFLKRIIKIDNMFDQCKLLFSHLTCLEFDFDIKISEDREQKK